MKVKRNQTESVKNKEESKWFVDCLKEVIIHFFFRQWEEKYGREANHIAAEFKKREEKRLANPDYKPKKKPAPRQAHITAAPAEPVHPSWEAKRLQEEIMSKALSGKGGPSNNKIVFEDSD